MATSWGSGDPTRCYFDYTVTETSSSVTIKITGYVDLKPPASSSGSWTCSWSGEWGSGSSSKQRDLNINGGGRDSAIKSGTYTIAKKYGSTDSVSFKVTGETYWGTATHTLKINIPARAYSAPRPPSSVSASRTSDTQMNVAWVRDADSSSGARPWSGVYIERWAQSTNTWTRVATITSTASSWTDTGTKANDRYRYRISSYNSGGTSSPAYSGYLATTPTPPTGLTAEKQLGGSIIISWTNTARYMTAIDIYDNNVLVGTAAAGATSWTHPSPATNVTHTYSITTKADSLSSVRSANSNTVQLTAPPNAPSNPHAIPAVVSQDATGYTITWVHNPTDSSAQSAYQVGVKAPGAGSFTALGKVNSSAQQVTIPFSSLPPAIGTWQFQVQTWGAHANPSPYSATASFSVEATPAVSIQHPLPGDIITTSTVSVAWTYSQAQSRPQQRAVVSLFVDGTLVWVGEQVGTMTTFDLPYAVQDTVTYDMKLDVYASNGLFSTQTIDFRVDYIEPATPTLDIVFDSASGGHQISIENGETPVETVTNRVYRNVDQTSSWYDVPSNPVSETIVNQFTTPSFELTSGHVVRRTNFILSPSSPGTERATVYPGPVGYDGWTFAIKSMSGLSWIEFFAEFPPDAVEDYTFIIELLNPLDEPQSISLQSSSGTVGVTLAANEQRVVHVPGTLNIGDEDAMVICYISNSYEPIAFKDATLVLLADHTGSPFTGDSDSRRAKSYEWLGTEGNSASVEVTPTMAVLATGTNTGVEWIIPAVFDGESELDDPDITCWWNSDGSFSAGAIAAPGLTYPSGWAILSDVWMSEGQYSLRLLKNPATAATYLSFAVPGGVMSSIAVHAELAGQEMKCDGTAVATTVDDAILRGNAAATVALGPGRWDLLTMVHGAFSGNPFSGDTQSTVSGGMQESFTWNGTPHSSASTRVWALAPFNTDEWEFVGEFPPNAIVMDYEGTTYGRTMYIVEAVSAVPSSAMGFASCDARSTFAWVGAGPNFADLLSIPYNVRISSDANLGQQEEHELDGIDVPILITGFSRRLNLDVDGTLDPAGGIGSDWRDVERIAFTPGSKCYRDHDGRRLYVSLPNGIKTDRETRALRNISFSVSEVANE